MSEQERASEDAWTESLRAAFPAPHASDVGIGDDAARIRFASQDVVIAQDVLVDGRHFVVADCGLEAAVYKAVGVNVSDLAAVAAQPHAFVLGVVMPQILRPATWQPAVLDGMRRACEAYQIACVGGDTNVGTGPVVLSVTAFGNPGPGGFIARHGARVGDVLSVTGPLGGSAHGRHLRPNARVSEALVLAESGIAHAMLDLSDGLSTDLPRLCAASGVGALIHANQLPVHTDVAESADRVRAALNDGEDFELLVAHAPLTPADHATLHAHGVSLIPVGTCEPAAHGIQLMRDGSATPLRPGGFDHFVT